jgi:predicted aspartyl protease
MNRAVVRQSKEKKDIQIEGLLANPANRDLNCTLTFCVDTGASITVIPKKIAKKLRLVKDGTAKIQLGDGRIIENDLAYVYLYVAGEGLMVFAAITSSDEDENALLGCDVMELLQFQVDVARKKILKPVRRFKVVSMLIRVTGRRLCEMLSKKR